jgi:hypothetical protein
MMPDRVRCECGEWRYFPTDWNGCVVETCYGCGYRLALRGRVPTELPALKVPIRLDNPNLPQCAWPDGCVGRVARPWMTDLCGIHAEIRRKSAKRDYAREYMEKKDRKRRLVTRAPSGVQGQAYAAKRRAH